MIRKAVCIAIAAVAIAAGASAQQSSMDEAEIKALSRQGHEAHMRGDRAVVASLLASDYVKVNADTTTENKQQQVDSLGACGVASLNIIEQNVRVYGSVAVETTLAALTLKDTTKGTTSTRYTAVWAKRDGRWQVVHLHH